MLPSEIPWVLYEGSGDRGPFSLVVDGTPITYADVAHIRVTRFDEDGVATVLVEGTDYQLSATAALPDLNDVSRPVTAASFTLKVVQPVLDEGQYVLAERIAPADQSLSYTQAGGFSSSVSERNLDAIVRVIQQMYVSISRGIFSNRLDGIPTAPLELPTVADRADKFFYFDADGNPALASPSVGLGDLISSNNLSDLDSPSAARTNLGLTSLATTAPSSVFFVANNLSEGNAATMRANLGVYSTAQADGLITTHVALSDPHTQYLLESAVSANGLTLIGQTFANMKLSLSLSQADISGLTTASSPSFAGLTSTGRVTIANTLPQLVISETDQGTDGKNWDIIVNGGTLTIRALNDALNSATNLVTFTRSGMTLTAARWGATMTPAANDGNAIGEPSVAWSDAYFATGAVLGFGNGNLTLTHSSNQIACSGNFKWGNTSQGTLTYTGSDAYIDSAGSLYLRPSGASVIATRPVRLPSYTVAGLPAGSTGDTAYASNGRKNGEGAGLGTGVLVFKDGTAWRACDTGATVAA